MGSHKTIIFLPILFLIIIIPIGQLPQAFSDASTLKNQAYAYVENVLPFDMTQYTINFDKAYSLPSSLGDPTMWEAVTFNLNSNSSTIHVVCLFINGALQQCGIDFTTGSPISDRQYSRMAEAVARVLQQHQEQVGVDSTQLISMLSLIDETKTTNVTSGNINLQISRFPVIMGLKTVNGLPVPIASDSLYNTIFSWKTIYNGADFNHVSLTFDNGILSDIQDDRAAHPIGGIGVNVTQEQAIEIAKQYISNYTNKFNLTITKASATLTGGWLRNYTALYPAWSVLLDFDMDVQEVNVNIWADSGQVFWCYQGGSPMKMDVLTLESRPTPNVTANPPIAPPQQTTPLLKPTNISAADSEITTPTPTSINQSLGIPSLDLQKATEISSNQQVTLLIIAVVVAAYVAVFAAVASFRGRKRVS